MGTKKKRWLWLLLILLISFLFVLRNAVRQEVNPPENSPGSPASEDKYNNHLPEAAHALPKKAAPSYVPVREARLQEYLMEAEYVLTGKVTSEDGGALPGAIVSLHSSEGEWPEYDWSAPIVSQICDNDGQYTIRLRLPMHAYVRVREDGFTQREAEINFVVPETIEMNLRLRPAPACAEGYVLDTAGAPVPGALVGAIMADSGILLSFFSPIGTNADSGGKYTLRGLPEGNQRLAAYSETHAWEATEVNLKAGGCQRVDIRLAEALVLTFSVRDIRGQTIRQANAAAAGYRSDEAYFGAGDDQGVIKLPIPPDLGPFNCTIAAAGHKTKKMRMDPHAPPAEVVLEDADTPGKEVFKGRVIDESGQPVAGAKLQASGEAAGTDKDGRFSLAVTSESPSGSRITVSKPGFITQTVIPGYIEQPGGHLDSKFPLSEVLITLKHEVGGIYGRAMDADGRPIKRFILHLVNASGVYYSRSFDNDDGLFSIRDIPAGVYDLFFRSSPVNDREAGPLGLDLRHIELRQGYFYGEVVAQLVPPRPIR